MSHRKQIKLTFQIGFEVGPFCDRDHVIKGFTSRIAQGASRVCGGCTTSLKDGWWAEDGATHGDTFQGTVQRETCVQLELTCEPHKEHRAFEAMKECITAAATNWDIDTDWVHVTRAAMEGMHFSVKALNNPPADKVA